MSNLRLDQAVEIKAELENLNYADLKAKFIELGIGFVFKAGVKKSVLIQSAMKALEFIEEETEISAEETEKKASTEEDEDQEELPEGEYEIDEEALVEYPKLVQMGFTVGDTLVVEVGKPWSKKEIKEDPIKNEEAELQAKSSIDLEGEEAEVRVEEIEVIVEEIETIDEDLYTEAEILENIEIVQCNMIQAIPTTRNFLLRKLDALQKALDRKQVK